jgi:hypothetical protein
MLVDLDAHEVFNAIGPALATGRQGLLAGMILSHPTARRISISCCVACDATFLSERVLFAIHATNDQKWL